MIDHLRLQIEQAAKGCISGSLDEWPHLDKALKTLGYDLPSWTHYIILRQICIRIMKHELLDADVHRDQV